MKLGGLGRAAVGVILASLAACQPSAPPQAAPTVIGLSSSLPLVWGESGDIRGQLATKASAHWAMKAMAGQGRVVPLDTLAASDGRLPLGRDAVLVLVQPRPLTPDENVALDAWVRQGGRLLLFADPMLTADSAFALGDPRRPEAIAMLSPILRHWGIELQYDPEQPGGRRHEEVFGIAVPIELAGRFALHPRARCRVEGRGIAVDCVLGKGRVIALADAALFDGDDAGQATALTRLLGLLQR